MAHTQPDTQFDSPDADDSIASSKATVFGRIGLLILRVILGCLFLYSGLAKLGILGKNLGSNPREFATAIHKFQFLHYDLIPDFAFIIPWAEAICGFALLVGFMTRGAAALLKTVLLVFVFGMLAVVYRGIEVGECSCFGGKLATVLGPVGEFLEAPIGWISIIRNLVLMGLCLLLVVYGSGYLSIDRLFSKKSS